VTAKIPAYFDLVWPALQAAKELGGSASNQELDAAVIEREQYPEDVQAILHKGGPQTELQYRLAWARTILKNMGLLTRSGKGVWSVTQQGQTITEPEMRPLYTVSESARRKGERELKKPNKHEQTADTAEAIQDEIEDEVESEGDWKDELLDTLIAMTPSGFERLAQRLLRESGFSSVKVTGKSGDGGIDGLGVYQMSLLTFPVFFQCKRYKGSVGSGAVRDFRGAMAGRGDKGLLITTGNFTNDAYAEAKRDGAPSIDLIDGSSLCDLLKEIGLGVTTEVVERVTVHPAFFQSLEPNKIL
jgi:restriction system protein